MTAASVLTASAKFALWEGALGAAAASIFGVELTAEAWLLLVCAEIALESSVAAAFSFARANSAAGYWCVAAACAVVALARRRRLRAAKTTATWSRWMLPVSAALAVPLLLAAFHPVHEIDSVNYLHYLIEWMANRATPYTFSTYYVAFWELSFLPAWVITGVDLFFPLLALKATIVLGLAAWLAGRELGVGGWRLGIAVAAACVLPHLWSEPSGVPTLKNDPLHGAGFVLLAIAVMRAARRFPTRADAAILMFGAAFAPVKYTGAFLAVIAVAAILWLRRGEWRRLAPVGVAVAAFGLATSWHYYLAHVLLYRNPFYPVRLNLGPLHLPGEADVSGTAILDSIGSPVVWRAFFWPSGGISPGGLLFPLLFAAILIVAPVCCVLWVRRGGKPDALAWAALLVCCGWFLYFRTFYGASMLPGDLTYMRNGLNTLRYVDGVWAVSLLILAALFPRVAPPLIAVQFVSCLAMLYARIPAAVYPVWAVVGLAFVGAAIFLVRPGRAAILAGAALVAGCAFAVEANRPLQNPQWSDLAAALNALRGPELATLTVEDGGYFAGQIAAAGNPVDEEVRSFLPEELAAIAPARRPRYVAVLAVPGADAGWRARHSAELERLGYASAVAGKSGEIYRWVR